MANNFVLALAFREPLDPEFREDSWYSCSVFFSIVSLIGGNHKDQVHLNILMH